jgi:hypothetical protein
MAGAALIGGQRATQVGARSIASTSAVPPQRQRYGLPSAGPCSHSRRAGALIQCTLPSALHCRSQKSGDMARARYHLPLYSMPIDPHDS